MVVDKLGLHCVAVCDLDLFYMNWNDAKIQNMASIFDPNVEVQKPQRYIIEDQPCNITAVDIALEPGEDCVFDIVFGT